MIMNCMVGLFADVCDLLRKQWRFKTPISAYHNDKKELGVLISNCMFGKLGVRGLSFKYRTSPLSQPAHDLFHHGWGRAGGQLTDEEGGPLAIALEDILKPGTVAIEIEYKIVISCAENVECTCWTTLLLALNF